MAAAVESPEEVRNFGNMFLNGGTAYGGI